MPTAQELRGSAEEYLRRDREAICDQQRDELSKLLVLSLELQPPSMAEPWLEPTLRTELTLGPSGKHQ